jgi:hypothetical protein
MGMAEGAQCGRQRLGAERGARAEEDGMGAAGLCVAGHARGGCMENGEGGVDPSQWVQATEDVVMGSTMGGPSGSSGGSESGFCAHCAFEHPGA